MQWVIAWQWWQIMVANDSTPFELQLPFFKVILEKGDLSTFETWVYNESNLEKYLTR